MFRPRREEPLISVEEQREAILALGESQSSFTDLKTREEIARVETAIVIGVLQERRARRSGTIWDVDLRGIIFDDEQR